MQFPERSWSYLISVVITILCVGTSPASGQFPVRASGCAWQPGFHISGPALHIPGVPLHPDLVYDAVVFDDGSGTALYVGGSFLSVDDLPAFGIAKWDGAAYTPLPTAGQPSGGVIHDMAVIAGGALAGIYTSGPGGIGRFDGTAWSTLPAGPAVDILAGGDLGSGPRLFAGGSTGIFQWNGSTWSQLGGDTDAAVRSLAVWNDGGGNQLYAAGSFTQVGAVAAARVARWNGSFWSPLGSGLSGRSSPEAETILGIGSRLYVGGSFTTAGGAPAANIASWNGTAWSALGSGTDGAVEVLAAFDDGSGSILGALGSFTTAGGAPADQLAIWNGTSWSDPHLDGISPRVRTLIQFDEGDGNALFAGGTYVPIGGAIAGNLRRWHDGSWSTVTAKSGGKGVEGSIDAMAVHDDGGAEALYVHGRTPAPGPGGSAFLWLMKLDGDVWSFLPNPGGSVSEMLSYDDGGGQALYAGYVNPTIGFSAVSKWDGAAWTSLGLTSSIFAMAEYDDGGGKALYAAGSHQAGNPNFDSAIARWDGLAWSPVGAGIYDNIRALAVYDDGGGAELYAAGDFTEIGDSSPTPAARIAKWDGTAWSPVGAGLDDRVEAMTVWNDGGGNALYVVGRFTTAGGVSAPGIAKWNGSAWSAVGGGATRISEIVVFDDGAGSALYVSGPFTTIGGQPIARAARWDGATWTAIGTGSAPQGELAVYDSGMGDALFFGGSFTEAGGLASYNIAQFCRPGMFVDGFESGDTGGWSQVFP